MPSCEYMAKLMIIVVARKSFLRFLCYARSFFSMDSVVGDVAEARRLPVFRAF